MTIVVGRNRNTNSESTVSSPITINSTTAVEIAPINNNRLFFYVTCLPGLSDKNIFIRFYPHTDDNEVRGVWIGRYNQSNDVFFQPHWEMPSDNIYTGPISAILAPGESDELVYVTEY